MLDKTKIPKSEYYCYGEDGVCPYWSLSIDYEEQNNGYCFYLNYSDWEETKRKSIWKIKQKDNTYKEIETSGEEQGIFTGLLWDQIKACNINI